MENGKKEFVLEDHLGRRGFLKNSGLAGMGIAGTALLGGSAVILGEDSANAQSTLSANDIAILNFALNLEYLEAEFYTKATTGKTIAQIGIGVSGVGDPGPTVGGTLVNFAENDGENNTDQNEDANIRTIALQIAKDEQEHVKLLRSVLGSHAIAKPEINLNALGLVSNRSQFLREARAFEDVGVSAYGGAAPLIQSKAILAAAARIALTEGEHTGLLRVLVALNDVRTAPLDSQDIVPPPSGTEFFSNNDQGLTIVRTPSEVLAIVFGSSKPGTVQGAFFPDGVNGPIRSV